jgi:hypothetical protein
MDNIGATRFYLDKKIEDGVWCYRGGDGSHSPVLALPHR